MRLTLWGKQAEQYNAPDAPVIAFKGVKVGDFGGKSNPGFLIFFSFLLVLTCIVSSGRSLSMVSSSTMAINPDIDDSYALRGWYDSTGAGQSFQAHANTGGGGGTMGGFNRAEMRSINEVKEAQLGSSDKVDYFSTRATIMHIKSDNISYPACQTPSCNKKVIETGDSWRCEKCDKSFPAPDHRFVVSQK